jgi:hypothetical protein
MIRVRRLVFARVITVLCLGCAGFSPAFAGTANFSWQGPYIAVEGYTQNPPPPYNCPTGRCVDSCTDGRCSNFLVTARDDANQVIPNLRVFLDFSGCSDIQIACDQLTPETGQDHVSPGIVEGYTNAQGQFTFRVQGRACCPELMIPNINSPGTNVGVPCATLWADGAAVGGVAQVTSLIVAAYDANGAHDPSIPSHVDGGDVALVANEALHIVLGAQARARDDYNNSSTVNGADVAIMGMMVLQAALLTGSKITGPICP